MCSSSDDWQRQTEKLANRIEELVTILTNRMRDDRVILSEVKSQATMAAHTVSSEAFASLFSGLLLAIDRLNGEEMTEQLVMSVIDEILDVCAARGLTPIDASGEFDPHVHEAVGVINTSDSSENGMIVRVERTGYSLAGKVLRPARVVVAKWKQEYSQRDKC